MNKKIKNIVSVIQSVAKNLGGTQRMPSGSFTALHMTKSTLYSVLCTLCTVLFLASCNDESLVDNPHAQNALRTVSVDLGMPQGKPAFGEGTTSRAADAEKPAEILLGDSTLAVSRTSSDTYYTTSNWVDGDWLLVKIEAGSTQGRLTLEYHDSEERPTQGWHLLKNCSYFKYKGDTYYWYNDDELPQGVLPILEITESEENAVLIDTSNPLTIHLDWTATAPTVSLIYINPESMTWDNTGKLSYYWGATEAPELWIADGTAWTTPQARLRVHTGAEGDVVKLTSSVFDTASDDEPGTYEATTDAEGNAYFYGATTGELKGDFIVQLTQMRVAVQQPSDSQGSEESPASEGRSVSLEGENTLVVDLDTPITLLEASDVVPVTLAATKAYKLIMSADKRNTQVSANLNVIDGSCTNLDLITKQIETAMAMGITKFTVINQLASYSKGNAIYAGSVVGEAIRQFGSNNVDTKITLMLADATEVIDGAFIECTALKSVSAPAATTIGENAFALCSALTSVSLPEATNIGEQAFVLSGLIGELSLPAATTIGISAFLNCTALMSVSLPNATTIDDYAFVETGLTGELSLPAAETIGVAAFQKCTALTKVVADKATTIGMSAFQNCTALMCVSLPKATTIGVAAFQGCAALTTVLFGTAVTGLGDMAFDNVPTEDCALTLHADQLKKTGNLTVSISDGKLMWAGKQWQSITLSDGTKYTIVDGVPTVEVDGTIGGKETGEDADVTAMNSKIKVVADAAATTNVSAKVIVKNELAAYTNATEYEIYAGTVVGEAIRQLTPSEEPRSAKTVNYNGRITLTLDNATELPEIAFAYCNALQNVSAPNATEIGPGAFISCTALTSVSLPVATTIGVYAFYDVTLANLEIGANAATDITLGEQAFTGSTINGHVKFHKVVTGDGITQMNAFSEVTTSGLDLYLAAEQPAEQITASGGKLMWAGAEWKSITVGDKVYTQETGFVKLTIAGTETYAVIDGMYGHYTGEDGTEDQFNAYREKVKDQIKAATARINSFYVINELGTYKYNSERNFPVTSSVVGQAFTAYANDNTTARVSITLVDATSVPKSAFNGCTALTDINLDKVASIGDDAFRNCTALTSVTTAATQIGNSAFNGCTNLQSATFTSDNTEIGPYAFSGCTNLTTLSWNKVTSIGDYAFSECKALENVSSSTVTTVGNFAFRNCTFKTVSLPEVTTLTNNVFKNCTSLKQLTLGNVTSVDLGQYTHSFKDFNTEDCDLTLGAGQEGFSNDNISNGIWAGMQWKSITVGGEQKYSSANAQANQ